MDRLDKYIKLIVNVGVNIQKGQKLLIRCPVDCAYFARKAMDEAYQAGAGKVYIQWQDDISSRIQYLAAPDEIFGVVEKWEKDMYTHFSNENYALISLSASDPEGMKGIDPERILLEQKAHRKAMKSYTDKAMMNEIQWCVVSVPTEAWAKKVFPKEKKSEKAMQKLWDAIYEASRIDDNDPVENWKKHKAALKKNIGKLQKYNFKYLQYKNSLGTDLQIELPEGHIWLGGEENSKSGIPFMANIPTEEVFTAPLRTGVNGVVVSTKPLVHMGDVIEDFTVEFKEGKVVKVLAKKNQHLLEKLIAGEKNADYLGEVALVPYDSPISNAKILFFNTLYDENASCHLAFGRAYPDCVGGTEGKTEKELNAMGVNQSQEHKDFMIGSADLSIVGIKHDGKKVQIFKDGNFAF